QGQAAAAFHFLHDGVSVPLRLREGEKDFELDCGKWEEGGGISIPGECIHQEYSRVSQARRQAWHDAACPDRTATAHRRWLDVCCYFRCIVSKRGGTCEDPYSSPASRSAACLPGARIGSPTVTAPPATAGRRTKKSSPRPMSRT